MHVLSDYRQFTFDLTKASISSDSNPFVSSSSSTSGTSSPSQTGSQSSPSSSSGSDSDSGSGSQVVGAGGGDLTKYQTAHGVLMAVAVVVLFPFGAIMMRFGAPWWLHSIWQWFSLAALIAGMGVGIKMGRDMAEVCFAHTLFNRTPSYKLVRPHTGESSVSMNNANPIPPGNELRHVPQENSNPLPPHNHSLNTN